MRSWQYGKLSRDGCDNILGNILVFGNTRTWRSSYVLCELHNLVSLCQCALRDRKYIRWWLLDVVGG